MHNKLCFITQDTHTTRNHNKINSLSDNIINSVHGSALHNLWHHRLSHAGNFVTSNIDKVTNGVPNLRNKNPLFSCKHCSSGKTTKQIRGYTNNPTRATKPNQRFCMDYGFVRGREILEDDNAPSPDNTHKPRMTSKDGYNCYLFIVDEFSRYL